MSLPEVLLWKAIKGGARSNGLHFRKQHPIGPYVLDFYCDAAKLAVEVDGANHGPATGRPATNGVTPGWRPGGSRPCGCRRRSSCGTWTPRCGPSPATSSTGTEGERCSRQRAEWAATPSVAMLRTATPPPQSGFALGEDLEEGSVSRCFEREVSARSIARCFRDLNLTADASLPVSASQGRRVPRRRAVAFGEP